MNLGLDGSRAVVTGGAGGIGAAIAARLSDEGCAVAILDLDGEAARRVAESLRGRAVGISCDVRSADEVHSAVVRVVDELGGVDLLVNNAGVLGPIQRLADYSEQDFIRIIDIDLLGTYRACHAVLPYMQRQGGGRIVNIASISGKEGNPMMTAYASAKAGVIGLTKSLGKELALDHILVNCITPGGVNRTNIMAGVPVSEADDKVLPPPMGRYAEPEEIAAMTAWLCSAEASYSTGAVFDISGGRAMY